MKRRKFIISMGMGMASVVLPGCLEKSRTGSKRAKPNILFIMTDDHASHAIGCYGSKIIKTPNIDRIADQGMRFDNCFCTNSICAPSRAVILTGKHSHLNGVRDNRAVFDGSQQTFPKLMQEAGYQTAIVGKWHLKSDPTGFDYWHIHPRQGYYYNPDMIEMGKEKRLMGYATDLETDIAIDFIQNKRDKTKPFMVMLHHKAPHRSWQPAPRHMKIFDETTIPEAETLFDDYSTRSAAAREQKMTIRDHLVSTYDLKIEGSPPRRMTEEQRMAWEEAYGQKRRAFEEQKPEGDDLVRWKYQRYMQDYLGCVVAVDENIGRILDFLDDAGLAENTVVIYTSDQGFYLGDHGWYDKRFMYEESLRMPLLIRFPGHIIPGSESKDLVCNLDFAPTLLGFAGLKAPQDMQGRSFLDFFGKTEIEDWRNSIYYHYYEYPGGHNVKRHYGVRTTQYKMMHFYYDIDAWELYDLEKDPRELNNVYNNPSYARVRDELRVELKRLQDYYGDSTELAHQFLKKDLEENIK